MDALRRFCRHDRALMSLLLAFVLASRLFVPAGWMPSTGAIAIELCTSDGVAKAWIDDAGRVHKSEPKHKAVDHPCAFSGLSSAGSMPADLTSAVALPAHHSPPLPHFQNVTVGRGLAAPPPYQTGPPLLA